MAHVICVLEEPDEETPTIQLSSSRVGLEAQPGSDMPIYEVDRVLTAPSPDVLFAAVAPTLAFDSFCRLILCVGPGSLDACVGDLAAAERRGLAPRCLAWLGERAAQLRRDGCECAVAVAVTAVGDGSAPAARKPQDLLGRVPGEEGKTTWRPCDDDAGGLQLVRDGLKRRHADCSVVIRFALSARAPDGGAHTLVVAVAAVATANEKLSLSRVMSAVAERRPFVPVRESKIARVVGEEAVASACFVVSAAGDRTTCLDLLDFATAALKLSAVANFKKAARRALHKSPRRRRRSPPPAAAAAPAAAPPPPRAPEAPTRRERLLQAAKPRAPFARDDPPHVHPFATAAAPPFSPPPPEYDLVPTPHGKRGFSDDDEPPPEYGSLARALPPPPPGISPAKPDDVFGDLAPTPPEAAARAAEDALRPDGGAAWREEKARLVAHYEHLITLLQDQLVAKNVENFELQTKLDDALGVTPASAIKDALG